MKVSCLLVGLVLLAALFVDITGKKIKKEEKIESQESIDKKEVI